MTIEHSSEVVKIARDYYDSGDADNFYFRIWGGEDIHVGLYESLEEPIFEASRRTVDAMAARLSLDSSTRLLDVGSGYGGAARRLARAFDLQNVVCLNLSTAQNERARALNREAGLNERIAVVDGAFESIPVEDASFDVVWCQDAILHSGDKPRVISEIARVLAPGGDFIFTDPMQADDCPPDVLGPVLARIHLDAMGSFRMYRDLASAAGLVEVEIQALSEQLPRHYARVKQELEKRYEDLLETCSEAYLENMKTGLQHWIDAGRAGHLAWGIMHFKKPA